MQAVVNYGFVLRLALPVFHCLVQALALVLDGKVDVRGGAAESRSALAGVKIISGHSAKKGQLEVRVHINAAGQQQHSAGVNHARASCRQIGAHLHNAPAFQQQVCCKSVRGSDHGAAFDNGFHDCLAAAAELAGQSLPHCYLGAARAFAPASSAQMRAL